MPELVRDDLDVPATVGYLDKIKDEIKHLPVAASNGRVFDFDPDSEKLIEENILNYDYLDAQGKTSHKAWKLNDNSFVPVSKAELENYLVELKQGRALRVSSSWPEFWQYKILIEQGNPPTKRDLENWKESYEVN